MLYEMKEKSFTSQSYCLTDKYDLLQWSEKTELPDTFHNVKYNNIQSFFFKYAEPEQFF